MKDKSPLKPTKVENISEAAAISLNAVPIVGRVLASTALSVITKRQNQRLEVFLQDLAQTLTDMQSRMNTDFVQSEGLANLAEDIFDKASEARQKEKLNAFKGIFLNTVFAQEPSYDEATEIADLVYKWQKRHIVLLHILADPLAANNSAGNVVGQGGGFVTSIERILSKLLPDWDSDQIERTWQDLYDAQIHRTSGTRGMMTDQEIHQLEGRLTNFGKKVANYIQSPQP